MGSSDRLYEIDTRLNRTVRPESIGGTPANRFIHRESNQLFIGPYAIGAQGQVRVIPYSAIPGRPTGMARHLTGPAGKVYLATMEEGFYEIDVRTLAVKQLYEDANGPQLRKESTDIAGPLLPGYHGKGFYSGQGRAVYANNGEIGGGSLPPDTPSGCLAEWDGRTWTVIRRNQFTEVTGPGGLEGNRNPATDPVWSIGWDHRSLILMVLDAGRWHAYRLPKASHAYDGAHGWNTEWPRIRDIGEKNLLMTMHGMFWRFPRTFRAANSAGLAPRSTYLRVVGDFARWQGRIVFGSDDTARSEFLNTRRVKGRTAGPGQSQSNLWFVEPARLDRMGVPLGRGGVWVRDDVKAGETSEPYLFSGFDRRLLHLAHEGKQPVDFSLEVDREGTGGWTPLRVVRVPASGYVFTAFGAAERGAWIRLKAQSAAPRVTAFFHYANADTRAMAPAPPAPPFPPGSLVWARGEDLLLSRGDALYSLDAALNLKPVDDAKTRRWMRDNLTPPTGVVDVDAASVIYTDEAGKRWRLPRGGPAPVRIAREVSTERDLLNLYGTFYELPANNAGGIAMVRPIATHNRYIEDFCSWRGLMVVSGLRGAALPAGRTVTSPDGKMSLWLGVSDDLWQFGKPRGEGGPWHETPVHANVPSDPYLMTGYDDKSLRVSANAPVRVRVEVDITGTGLWQPYTTLSLDGARPIEHRFPVGFNAYWVRLVALRDATVSAVFTYR